MGIEGGLGPQGAEALKRALSEDPAATAAMNAIENGPEGAEENQETESASAGPVDWAPWRRNR